MGDRSVQAGMLKAPIITSSWGFPEDQGFDGRRSEDGFQELL